MTVRPDGLFFQRCCLGTTEEIRHQDSKDSLGWGKM
jgi:hypothetical protein